MINGAENLGLTEPIARTPPGLHSPLSAMLATAGGAGPAPTHAGPPLVYTALLGTNIGPNITLTGSLAALRVR